MDKEVEQIMKVIEESLARDSKREHWALSPDEQSQCPHHARAVVDSGAG